MKSNDIRSAFLKFFEERGHRLVHSSPLIPGNDPTLLFTNAGMVQFKDVFLGKETRSYQRAASVQRCVRAGGKHNDLEKVGHTARHHTFFEMLGNFSFGDYFKREAIQYAWEFLTETLSIHPSKLWVSVHEKDEEAERIWLKELKIDSERFSRCGDKDNFWAMGETGPCGPCTEIFYDHGPSIAGGPPGSKDADGDRYVEIWNLVFMQYERLPNGSTAPLPKPSVDTGMGLERLSAVLQGVHNNYETDLFLPLIRYAAKLANTKDLTPVSLKVIADHIRSCAFLVVDGVTPSNEGRGYVLRRILRRALRHGYQLGITLPFFYRLVKPLVDQMGEAYPELLEHQTRVVEEIRREEEQFSRTLNQGMQLLSQALKEVSNKVIPGSVLFKLYDTYGFPVDLVADVGQEKGFSLDMIGFEAEMATQRERARAASQFAMDYTQDKDLFARSDFKGYTHLELEATIVALYKDGKSVSTLEAGESGILVLEQTPFYAEGGGQIGDRGTISQGETCFEVDDTQKQNEAHLHQGHLKKGRLAVGDKVIAKVDAKHRVATMLNHSATHLLHAALRKTLGNDAIQKGSWVGPSRLRFDFSYKAPVALLQLQTVERLVNEEIRANRVVETCLTSPHKAMAMGALAFFGEKYGETVRVLKMGDFSMELCGGTHVARTGDIGCFKIISETGVSAGVRRIEAVTGEAATTWLQEQEALIKTIAGTFKVAPNQISEKVTQLVEKNRQLEKRVEQFEAKELRVTLDNLVAHARLIQGIKVLVTELNVKDTKALRGSVDFLKDKIGRGVVLLASKQEEKIALVAGVTKDCQDKIHAGELVAYVSAQLGGKGGGRADMAQGGGTDEALLPQALDSVFGWVEKTVRLPAV